ncbi:hypothetical protein BVY03_03615 [bacterium K02(2017)]|nr:hypothetical protein BVY03_03615 [bacterium K02(2017)]
MSDQVPTATDANLGYPQIEKLIENEDFGTINKSFADAYALLEKIKHDTSGGIKKQKAAQKAMKAYELTTELINELLKIKYQIIKLREEEAKKNE